MTTPEEPPAGPAHARRRPGRPRPRVVAPSNDDPLVRSGSGLLGGPIGRHAGSVRSWWTPLRVMLALTVFTVMLAWWQKEPCLSHPWTDEYQYTRACYSDVYALFFAERLDTGAVPYRDHPVEYPVLTGGLMWVASTVARAVAGPGFAPLWFFAVTALVLGACALVVTTTTVQLAGRRQWDAALVALAPILVFHAFTNWDLLAAALLGLGMVAWARRRPALAGLLLGLGAAAKLYPALLLVALLPLCLRAARMRAWWVATLAALGTWLAVNAPVFVLWRDSWWEFFRLNQSRPADWDSVWFQLAHYTRNATGGIGGLVNDVVAPTVADGHSPTSLNLVTLGCVIALWGAIGWLVWRAPRRARVAQVAFLVVVAFLLANKVWSPQYVIWYLPLAALALPRWRALLVWQATEVFLLFMRFYYFVRNDTGNEGVYVEWYFASVLIRDVVLLVLAGLVIRDIYRPERDVVRRSGMDDPAGGVLVGEPERWERGGEPDPEPEARQPSYA